METKRICPSCGRPLAADSPQGLCPECLIKAGFGTGVAPEPGGPTSQPPFTPPPLAELTRLFPQLEIVELLGRGGMGAVYRARQPALDRWVALKVLPPQSTTKAGFAERFNREARALARLSHANIVAVHEFGQVGGMPYFIMEYVEGVTLRRLVQERRLEPREALRIVPQICEALQFAHDEGVVHRDIKPENILLDKKGRVKIADFGIAKIVGGTPLTPSLSPSDGERVSGRTGEGALTQDQVLGTPHYMAPEQVEHPQTVDHRADIYSLGVVFYEMLTGELPLGKFQPPSKKVQVDVRLDEVVLHTLEKEPERRYQHASEVKTDLETISNSPTSSAPAVGERPKGLSGWLRRSLMPEETAARWAQLICFGVALLVLVLGFLKLPQFDLRPHELFFGVLLVLILTLVMVVAGMLVGAAGAKRPQRAAAPRPDATAPSAHEGALARACQEVKAPASWLVATGILNWIAIPLLVLVVGAIQNDTTRRTLLPLVPLTAFALSGVMIVAGLKMKRLEAHGLAVAGSLLAILVTPGNLIGLPVGIWSLVVLCRREVREAFGRGYWPRREVTAGAARAAQRPDRFWRRFAVAIALVLLALILIPIGALLLSIALPAISRAINQPSLTVTGTVSDAGTGTPIAGAHVSDNRYGAAASRSPQETWTDANGRYTLRTWPEEHTLAASAPGYETKLATLTTSFWGTNRAARMDFQLQPANPNLRSASVPALSPVIEHVVSRRDADKDGFVFFDLETGKASQPPFPLLLRSRHGFQMAELTPELTRWVRSNDFDLLFQLEEKRWSRTPLDLKPMKGGSLFVAEIEEIAANEVAFVASYEKTAGVQWPVPVVNLRYDDRVPSVCSGFITRNDTKGIFQFTGINTTPPGVKIRYRLVQPDRGTAAATPPETDALEHNRDVLRIRLQQAEAEVARLTKMSEAGVTTESDVEAAKDKVELLKAELDGDPVRYARAKLAAAERKLERASRLWEVGRLAGLDYEAAKADVEVAKVELQAALPKQGGVSFSPVIERVVNDDGAKRDFFIDLDTGRLFSPLPGFNPANTNAFLAWLRDNGVDAMGDTSVSIHGLVGMEMVTRPLANPHWESLKPQAALTDEVLTHSTPGSPVFLSAKGKLPETFLFRTREGGTGILQITGFTNNPRGVKIRYKLVQRSSSTSQVAESKNTAAKIEYAKYLGLAAAKFAADNDGMAPTNHSDLATWLLAGEDRAKVPPGFSPEQFEIVYRGRLARIEDASKTIILREKEATRTPDGQWGRVCVFADGHVESQAAAAAPDSFPAVQPAGAPGIPTPSPGGPGVTSPQQAFMQRYGLATAVPGGGAVSPQEAFRRRYGLGTTLPGDASVPAPPAQPPKEPPALLAQAAPGEYRVTLTNGVAFEVVAIASSPRSGMVWWRPDGTLLAEPPGDRLEFPSQSTGGKARTEFAILTRKTGSPAPDWEWPVACEPRAQVLHTARLYKTNAPAGSVEVIGFEKAPETLACRMGLPDGDWQRVATWDHAGTLLNTVNPNLRSLVQKTAGEAFVLTLRHEIDLDRFHLRLVARLPNGEHKTAQVFRTDRGPASAAQMSALIHDLKPADVVAYELYQVPARWIEIPNISIKPDVPPIQSPQPAATFGPVIERQLRSAPDAVADRVLDLDDGRLLSVPADVMAASVQDLQPLQNWMAQQEGPDLMVTEHPDSTNLYLCLRGVRLLRLEAYHKLDSITAGEARARITWPSKAARNFVAKVDVGSRPVWLFKTRQGGMGVLEMLESTDNPPGVKIRYKLVQDAEAKLTGARSPTPARTHVAEVRLLESNHLQGVYRWQIERSTACRLVCGVLDVNAKDTNQTRALLSVAEPRALEGAKDFTLRLERQNGKLKLLVEGRNPGEKDGSGPVASAVVGDRPIGELRTAVRDEANTLSSEHYRVLAEIDSVFYAGAAVMVGPRLQFVMRLASQDDPVKNLLGSGDTVKQVAVSRLSPKEVALEPPARYEKWTFGPLVQHQLAAAWAKMEQQVLDLDENQLLTAPTNILMASFNNPRPLLNWMVQNHADLIVSGDSPPGDDVGFHLDDGLLVRVDAPLTFDGIDARDVQRHLAKPGASQSVSIPKAEASALPVCMFRTREGGRGVLQVMGYTDNPCTVKIRYKLLGREAQKPATAAGGASKLTVAQDGSGTHASIQAALGAAADGELIRIGPGRYEESLVITKPVSLLGAGWDKTVIGPTKPMPSPSPDAMQEVERRLREAKTDEERNRLRDEAKERFSKPVVCVQAAKGVRLEGIRFTQPGSAPEGRLLDATVVAVRGAEASFPACAVVGSPGNGIVVTEGARVSISNTLVAAVWNTGLRVERGTNCHVVVTDSDIRNCHYAGIVIGRGQDDVTVQRCRISGAAWHGLRYDDASPTIADSLIFANARCGIYASGRTAAQVRGNVFWKNEMSGVACWFESRDRIASNTLAANLREGLAVLGASAPAIERNIFWQNPQAVLHGNINSKSAAAKASGRLQLRENLFWTNGVNIASSAGQLPGDTNAPSKLPLTDFPGHLEGDPGFRDAAGGDFALLPDAGAAKAGIGAPARLSAVSPWPLQPEEKSIIPDGDTRDLRQWKRPAGG